MDLISTLAVENLISELKVNYSIVTVTHTCSRPPENVGGDTTAPALAAPER